MVKRKTTKKTSGSKRRDVLVVASKVKAYVKSRKMNTSADAINTLSERIYTILDDATTRTKLNGRKTLKSQDI
ncbi:MAG: hypothetical protein IID39_00685 [Planctomycetes bacterium]|nr:hypothetical protein [Planctomycetota bacterium]